VATLVVPFWPSSHVWPIIGRNVLVFVVDYKLFSGRTVLKQGRNANSLLGSKRFSVTLMMISNDLFEICLVNIRTLVRSYINKRAPVSDWESNSSFPAYILRLKCIL